MSWFAADPHHVHNYYLKMVVDVLIVLAVLALLHAMPRNLRKPIVGWFTFIGGLYYFLEFFLPAHPQPNGPPGNFLTPYQDVVSNVSAVIGSFGIGLGIISVIAVHGQRLARRQEGWGNSIALIVSLIAMCVFTLMNEYSPKTHLGHIANSNITAANVFHTLFNGGLVALDSATFSLIGFYIASASYRAFRARSAESTLLMAAALVVMVASTTLGTALTNWIPNGESPLANLRIEHISEWILTRVNTPAQRGIIFGLELGGLAIALRLWLSLERGAYFDREI